MCPLRDDPGSHNRAGVATCLSAARVPDPNLGDAVQTELCVRCANQPDLFVPPQAPEFLSVEW